MKRIFITGGTGFFGKSILAKLSLSITTPPPYGRSASDLPRSSADGRSVQPHPQSSADGRSAIGQYTILSRNPAAFRAANPQFANLPFVSWAQGDVRDFDFSNIAGDFDAIIHAATPAVTDLADDEMTSIIVEGTRHVIDFAHTRHIPTILFTSSGAVYGQQPAPVTEDAPCLPATAYGKGNLAAERMLLDSGLDVRIARCFAFTGPYLNRRIHYAIGNFIQDVLDDKPIIVKGDGTPMRSYLYADDLIDWLFAILAHGTPGCIYNVGSPEAISIRDLAFAVCTALGGTNEIKILGTPTGSLPQIYVPDTTHIEAELDVHATVNLAEAIRRSTYAPQHNAATLSDRKIKALGWMPTVGLAEGLRRTMATYTA